MSEAPDDRLVSIIKTSEGTFYHEDFCRRLQQRADKVQALVEAAQVVNDALWGLGPTPRDHDRLEMALLTFLNPQEPNT